VRLDVTSKNVEVFLFTNLQGTGYVNNNPLNATDPTGMNAAFQVDGSCDPFSCTGGGGGGGGWGSYYVDGAPVTASAFGHLVDMGVAVTCPANTCSGSTITSNGDPSHWEFTAGADGSQGYQVTYQVAATIFGVTSTWTHGQRYAFPNDPSGVGPQWTIDPGHRDPNGTRWTNGDGWGLEWNKGRPGLKGWRGKDHWHIVDPSNPDSRDRHYSPGSQAPVPIGPNEFRRLFDVLTNGIQDLLKHPPQYIPPSFMPPPYILAW